MTSGVARASQSRLEIDLGAIVANWLSLKARLRQGADCAGVVKADAYGLGAAQIGPALARAGCRIFFVAQLGEGIRLRPLLPAGCDIFVLNGVLPGEAPEFRAAGIHPVLNDRAQIALWAGYAARLGKTLPAALHVDTGMSRLGLSQGDARLVATDPAALAGVELRYVMSHLARAEEEVAMNAAQLGEFTTATNLWPGIPASLANSSGIFLGNGFHFDLARPGAALYGINPIPGRPNPQLPVAMLSAPVLQLRDIAPHRTVGYGATYQAAGPIRVATIALGYADGWLRGLSNRGGAVFAGHLLPFIGRVSMDLITLDASHVRDLAVGDHVELLGPTRPVDVIADEAGTNGWEILTRLGSRAARSYRPA